MMTITLWPTGMHDRMPTTAEGEAPLMCADKRNYEILAPHLEKTQITTLS